MNLETKLFGTVGMSEEKKIHFPGGIIGFPDLKDFILIHDEEVEENNKISWMQSVQEPAFALPVINPLIVKPIYNPMVDDKLLKPLGEWTDDDLLVLVTITVPSDLTKMTVNLKAPMLINSKERKACQIILEEEEYPVKYPIYDILKAAKEIAEKEQGH